MGFHIPLIFYKQHLILIGTDNHDRSTRFLFTIQTLALIEPLNYLLSSRSNKDDPFCDMTLPSLCILLFLCFIVLLSLLFFIRGAQVSHSEQFVLYLFYVIATVVNGLIYNQRYEDKRDTMKDFSTNLYGLSLVGVDLLYKIILFFVELMSIKRSPASATTTAPTAAALVSATATTSNTSVVSTRSASLKEIVILGGGNEVSLKNEDVQQQLPVQTALNAEGSSQGAAVINKRPSHKSKKKNGGPKYKTH